MDSITTNTPAPTVSTEATQPVQQAQPDKKSREPSFKGNGRDREAAKTLKQEILHLLNRTNQ